MLAYKRIFWQSVTAGVLSAVAGVIYARIHFFATETDFSRIINVGTITGLSLIICVAAGLGYWGLKSKWGRKGEIIFNFAFSILSFAGVIVPISITLPLSIEYPELFPGLGVPMVFFPALAWFTVNPLFEPPRG